MVNKAAVIATLIIFLLIGLLLALAFHFYGVSVEAKGKVSQLQSDNALQAQTVATQAFNFQRSNQIAGAAQQYAVQITGKSQEREIEYRTILKSEPTCALSIPADIANSLYDYAYRLRASAMHSDTGQPITAAVSATTSRRITYCQAVLWIDPLLTLIDQANSQLAGIRQHEEARQK